jgi:predicted PurR-regulated permease PerM
MAWARGALVLAVGVLVGRFLLPDALPFFAAFVLALLLEPLNALFVRRGCSRPLAAFLSLAVLLLGGASSLVVAVWSIWSEAHGLITALPRYYRIAQEASLGWGTKLGLVGPGGLPDTAWQEPVRELFALTSRLLGDTVSGLAHLPDVALGVVLTILATYFVARDGPRMLSGLALLLPEPSRPVVLRILGEAAAAALGYLRAQFLLVATTAVLVTAGLLCLGSRYAVLLGAAAGLLDLVPALGATAILLPWGGYLLLTGQVLAGLRILILLALVALLREIVEVRVVGGQVGLHPLAALAAMYFGVKLFGPLGLAVGPVLLATTWAAAQPMSHVRRP